MQTKIEVHLQSEMCASGVQPTCFISCRFYFEGKQFSFPVVSHFLQFHYSSSMYTVFVDQLTTSIQTQMQQCLSDQSNYKEVFINQLGNTCFSLVTGHYHRVTDHVCRPQWLVFSNNFLSDCHQSPSITRNKLGKHTFSPHNRWLSNGCGRVSRFVCFNVYIVTRAVV